MLQQKDVLILFRTGNGEKRVIKGYALLGNAMLCCVLIEITFEKFYLYETEKERIEASVATLLH